MKFYIYCLILITFSCSKNQKSIEDSEKLEVGLTPLIQVADKLNYLKIDTLSNGYLVSYSKSMVNSGGYTINKLGVTGKSTILIQSPLNSMQNVNIEKAFISFIENNFKKDKLRSELMYSSDHGKTWKSLKTPLESIRTFFWTNEYLILEGNLNGSGQVVVSYNNGKNWRNYNYLSENIKSFYLIDYIDNKKILFRGYKSYNDKDGFLSLLDVKKNHFKTLTTIKDDSHVVKVNNKDKSLYCLYNDRKALIYTIKDDLQKKEFEFQLPSKTKQIEELYFNESCLIISVSNNTVGEQIATWISHNKGKSWNLFKPWKNFRLVNNTLGAIFVMDEHNMIYKGELK